MIYCETCTNAFSDADFASCPHCALAEGRQPVLATAAAAAPQPVQAAEPEPAPEAEPVMVEVLESIRRMIVDAEPPLAEPAPIEATALPQAPEGLNEGIMAVVDQIVAEAEAAPETSEPWAPEEEIDAFTAAEIVSPAAHEDEEPARGSIGGHVARELDVAALKKIRESGVFIMVLLGFPTAGKTWFLNRLKYEMQEGDAYACYPRRAPPGEVENTMLFTAHRFRKSAHDFYIIDIPGERFQKAVEGSFLGEPHELMRHVIFSGHAFLTLLPADETLLSERAHDVVWKQRNGQTPPPSVDVSTLPPAQALIDQVDALKKRIVQARKAVAAGEDAKAKGRLKSLLQERRRLVEGSVQTAMERLAAKNEELGDYIGGIGLMAQLMVVMDKAGAPDLPADVDVYEVFDRSRKAERKKPTKPMFVVLSKSDELTHRSDAVQTPIRRLVRGNAKGAAELQTLLHNPAKADAFTALTALRPGVARQIDEWFALTSFQFATAFSGVSRGSKEINYRLKHVGVTELIRAILKLKEHTEQRRPWAAVGGAFRRKPKVEAVRVAEKTP